MEQKRFKKGELTTGYIAEEFPDGFDGVKLGTAALKNIAAISAWIGFHLQHRGFAEADTLDLSIKDAARSVLIGDDRFDFDVLEEAVIWQDREDNFETLMRIETDWAPGDSLIRARVGDDHVVAQVTRKATGFRVRYRGADMNVQVFEPHVADLMTHMPVKLPPDMSKFLLCRCRGRWCALK